MDQFEKVFIWPEYILKSVISQLEDGLMGATWA